MKKIILILGLFFLFVWANIIYSRTVTSNAASTIMAGETEDVATHTATKQSEGSNYHRKTYE